MGGIFEEVPARELERLALLDPVASAEAGEDVVYAVQTGRDLIEHEDCGCLDGYTSDLPRSAAMLSYAAAASLIIVALAACASLLATGWAP